MFGRACAAAPRAFRLSKPSTLEVRIRRASPVHIQGRTLAAFGLGNDARRDKGQVREIPARQGQLLDLLLHDLIVPLSVLRVTSCASTVADSETWLISSQTSVPRREREMPCRDVRFWAAVFAIGLAWLAAPRRSGGYPARAPERRPAGGILPALWRRGSRGGPVGRLGRGAGSADTRAGGLAAPAQGQHRRPVVEARDQQGPAHPRRERTARLPGARNLTAELNDPGATVRVQTAQGEFTFRPPTSRLPSQRASSTAG